MQQTTLCRLRLSLRSWVTDRYRWQTPICRSKPIRCLCWWYRLPRFQLVLTYDALQMLTFLLTYLLTYHKLHVLLKFKTNIIQR